MILSSSIRVEGNVFVAHIVTKPEGPASFVQVSLEGYPLLVQEAAKDLEYTKTWYLRKELPDGLASRKYFVTVIEGRNQADTAIQDDFVSVWVDVGRSLSLPTFAFSLAGISTVAAVALKARRDHALS